MPVSADPPPPEPSIPPSPPAFFASRRERRLWLWTLAVVAGIYATLGMSSTLAEGLYHQGVSAVVFLTCMLLIGLAVLTQGLKARPRGLEVGVALGVAAVYLMVFARLTIPERSHLIEYSVVALFLHEALTERAARGRRVPVPALLAIGGTALVGVLDEAIQVFLPNRVFDPVDMLFNTLAAVMAVVANGALRVARRWAGRRRHG